MIGFWKTDHFVIFDIIYISVYLRHSRWYYWFNKWLLLFKHWKYFRNMYLLKLQMHKHGNSIYFMRDNMICFPKSGHKYDFNRDLKYNKITNSHYNYSPCLGSFFRIPILLIKINNFLYLLVSLVVYVQCWSVW